MHTISKLSFSVLALLLAVMLANNVHASYTRPSLAKILLHELRPNLRSTSDRDDVVLYLQELQVYRRQVERYNSSVVP